MIHEIGAHPVIRKIAVTAVVGAASFALSNLLFPSPSAQFAVTAAVGSVILIIQFLADFEKRLGAVEGAQSEKTAEIRRAVERGFAKINEATRLFGRVEETGLKPDKVTELVSAAAEIGPDAPPLVAGFVRAELDRMTELLRGLADLEATCDGEDRDWLLGLTRSATQTIDAVSLPVTDGRGRVFQDGFWRSDLGRRYLGLQRDAVQRGVRVRRVFVVERPELVDDADFRFMCRSATEQGIEVRILHPIPEELSHNLYDFILFDNVLSYEVTPAAQLDVETNPLILNTRLVLREDKIRDRMERYTQLWDSARNPLSRFAR
jgi:hypothetical protein